MQNETKNQYFNPTCVVTGKTDKLRMFAHRDKNDNMVGWVFLHEDVEPNGLTITTEYKELEDVQTLELP